MAQPASQLVARPKVIYVMGAGRSGSTILGVTLGNCEGVFFAGELDKWLGKAGRPPLQGAERERFWNDVREEVDAGDLIGGRARRMERSSALLHPRNWSARRRMRQRYKQVAEELYRAVAHVAGVTYVVDTSHYPLRARELQHLAGVDLFLMFVVRDPHSVVASFGRDDVIERRFGVLSTNLYLWLTYLLSMSTFLRHPRDQRLFVRHEEFLADPQAVVGQILERAGAPASTPDLARLHTGLPFQGNRLVRSDVVALEHNGAKAQQASLVTSLLQLPWRAVLSWLRPTTSMPPAQQPASASLDPTT
jgi:hypothetical protein